MLIAPEGEGGQLGGFYKKIKHGASFKVFIKNYKGAYVLLDDALSDRVGGVPLTTRSHYCESKPKCTHDGAEFKLSGSNFVNAKVRRDLTTFESFNDTESALPSTGFRKFMGEDGVERLLLSTNLEADVVGRSVWGEEDESKIIHEIFP
jgi:hypothetical protein